MIVRAASVGEAAALLNGRRYVCAEMLYQPRPPMSAFQPPLSERVMKTTAVFDHALQSRWRQLGERDAILLIANSAATLDSMNLIAWATAYHQPDKLIVGVIVNPTVRDETPPSTPHEYDWDQPHLWRRMTMTDRWARILFALDVAARLPQSGYLVMPAHDAVWGAGLLDTLTQFSIRHAKHGIPAAVSPFTYWQHTRFAGLITDDVTTLLNTALGRDPLFWWKLRTDQVQGFWGKMGMIPFALCSIIRPLVDTGMWEDDLAIDRAIRKADYNVRGTWIFDQRLYHQRLPVFDREGVRRVIERTLHYSLNTVSLTNPHVGGSQLLKPLNVWGELRRLVRPQFRRHYPQAQAMIRECWDEIMERVSRYGASWVDWGAYRYVARPGNPDVEVWQYSPPTQQ